jgi:Flp pilus assembly protein TadG
LITGWLVKIILGIALVGFLVIELGSPLVMQAQLDGVAHDAADAAGLELRSSGNAETAQAEAVRVADENDATLEDFAVVEQAKARVTVRKEARSFLLKKWDRTKSWYEVEKSATSAEEGE